MVIKSILARIWAVWGLVLFVITMLLFFPYFFILSFLRDPVRTRLFISSSRIWMGIYLPLIGCPLFRRGTDHFQKGKNYIVICNHNSLMDVPVTSPGIPGANKTIAKIEMAKIPVFGIIYKLGSVLVDRKSELSRRESYIKMKEVLAMGLHMCLYPEGTRNKTDQPLKPFHDGAFKLSIETRKEIIPAIIRNTRKVMPANKAFYLWPSPLYIHFLDPIVPKPGESAGDLKERAFETMKAFIVKSKG